MPRRRVLHPLRHLALTAGLALVGACQSAHGSTAPEQTRNPDAVGNFDRLSVSSALDVKVVRGDQPHIELAGPSEALDRVRIETRGSTLHISRERGPWRERSHHVLVTVTMPQLRGLEVSGASDLHFEGFEKESRVDISVTGASDVRGKLSSADVRVAVSGASDVSVDGSAERCQLTVSGASDVKLGGLACREYAVNLSGASDAQIHATRRLGPVKLSGASSLSYRGKPTMGAVSVSGAASLDKR